MSVCPSVGPSVQVSVAPPVSYNSFFWCFRTEKEREKRERKKKRKKTKGNKGREKTKKILVNKAGWIYEYEQAAGVVI